MEGLEMEKCNFDNEANEEIEPVMQDLHGVFVFPMAPKLCAEHLEGMVDHWQTLSCRLWTWSVAFVQDDWPWFVYWCNSGWLRRIFDVSTVRYIAKQDMAYMRWVSMLPQEEQLELLPRFCGCLCRQMLQGTCFFLHCASNIVRLSTKRCSN